MANIQYNYNNVITYRDSLRSNKQVIETEFNNYQNNLMNLEDSWKGDSGIVSQSQMEDYRNKYNLFLQDVQNFINELDLASRTFEERESRDIADRMGH